MPPDTADSTRVREPATAQRCSALLARSTLLAAANDHGSVFVWRLGGGSDASGGDAKSGAIAGGAPGGSGGGRDGAEYSSTATSASGGGESERATKFEPLQKLQALATYITKCLITPDCRRLGTSSSDHSVKIWVRSLTPLTPDRPQLSKLASESGG